LRVRFRLRLFVEHHLHDSRAVAHVQKQQIPQVAPPVHPTHHRRLAPRISRAQRPAIMCSLQTPQKVQHVRSTCSSGLQARGLPTLSLFHSFTLSLLYFFTLSFSHLFKYATNSPSRTFPCVPSAKVFTVHSPLATSSSPRINAYRAPSL